jgi:hypothetical protein
MQPAGKWLFPGTQVDTLSATCRAGYRSRGGDYIQAMGFWRRISAGIFPITLKRANERRLTRRITRRTRQFICDRFPGRRLGCAGLLIVPSCLAVGGGSGRDKDRSSPISRRIEPPTWNTRNARKSLCGRGLKRCGNPDESVSVLARLD